MSNKKRFNKICRDIKSIKIQGARNVALAGLEAYKLFPTERTKRKLLSLRPTEPFLINLLRNADALTVKDVKKRLSKNQEIINKEVFKLIRKNYVVFTHCHSSTVVEALIYSKKKGKKFEVYLTETRPLFQGRKTAKELRDAGIKVTLFVDSAAAIALEKEDKEDKIYTNIIFLGADAITKKGTINKVGSGMFCQIAKMNKIPVYILADSLKYVPKIKLEKRPPAEVWKTRKIHIFNTAFELIKRKYIQRVISEFGLLSYRKFLKEVKKS